MSFTPDEIQKIEASAERWAERRREAVKQEIKDRDDRILYGVKGIDNRMSPFK